MVLIMVTYKKIMKVLSRKNGHHNKVDFEQNINISAQCSVLVKIQELSPKLGLAAPG